MSLYKNEDKDIGPRLKELNGPNLKYNSGNKNILLTKFGLKNRADYERATNWLKDSKEHDTYNNQPKILNYSQQYNNQMYPKLNNYNVLNKGANVNYFYSNQSLEGSEHLNKFLRKVESDKTTKKQRLLQSNDNSKLKLKTLYGFYSNVIRPHQKNYEISTKYLSSDKKVEEKYKNEIPKEIVNKVNNVSNVISVNNAYNPSNFNNAVVRKTMDSFNKNIIQNRDNIDNKDIIEKNDEIIMNRLDNNKTFQKLPQISQVSSDEVSNSNEKVSMSLKKMNNTLNKDFSSVINKIKQNSTTFNTFKEPNKETNNQSFMNQTMGQQNSTTNNMFISDDNKLKRTTFSERKKNDFADLINSNYRNNKSNYSSHKDILPIESKYIMFNNSINSEMHSHYNLKPIKLSRDLSNKLIKDINNKNINNINNIKSLNNNTNNQYKTISPKQKYIKNNDFTIFSSKNNINSNINLFSCYSRPGNQANGTRKTNQDSFMFGTNIFGIKNYTAFGVYDGHGVNGHFVSRHIKDYILEELSNTDHFTNKELKDTKLLYSRLTDNDNELCKKIYTSSEKSLLEQKFECGMSGCTAVTVIIIDNKIICINAGDSRAFVAESIFNSKF